MARRTPMDGKLWADRYHVKCVRCGVEGVAEGSRPAAKNALFNRGWHIIMDYWRCRSCGAAVADVLNHTDMDT